MNLKTRAESPHWCSGPDAVISVIGEILTWPERMRTIVLCPRHHLHRQVFL
jgi:hypothetical protein